MERSVIKFLRVFVAGIVLPVAAQGAGLQPPKVGLTMTWTCTGPFSHRYQVKVMNIKDGMVTYQGLRDDEDYWVEKAAWLTGTTLWVRKSEERYQWFDKADFIRYMDLQPGSMFKGAVPAREGADKWVWDYRINVDSPQRMKHAVLGEISVIPVMEKRRIYHGDYWSRMTSFVIADKGITVRWIYEDPRGVEDCDISNVDENGKLPKSRASKN